MKNIKLFEDWMETETQTEYSTHPLSGTEFKPTPISGRADLNAALLVELNKATNIRYGEKVTSNESMSIRMVKHLVKQGADIKLKSNRGENILLWAAHFNDVELARMCIKGGIPINETDGGGNTPLHWALDNKSFKVALYLVQNGADINKYDEDAFQPIHQVVLVNLNRGFGQQQLELLKNLIQRGADINSKVKGANITPLHLASGLNHLEIIKYLIQNGADVHAKDFNDMTPLHWASNFDAYEATQELINQRADVNAKTKTGNTPLHLCIETEKTELHGRNFGQKFYKDFAIAAKVANLLISAGAWRNVKNNEGKTAEDLAMECDNQELRKVIFRKNH